MALDKAVAEYQGRGDDGRGVALTDDAILARPFRLSQERTLNP